LPPIIASFSMIGESPMRNSACMILPSGPIARLFSSAAEELGVT
jgi:hypothetical protein